MTTELVTKKFNFEITSLSEAMSYAKMIAESDLAPKDYKGKPGNVLIAIQYGMEIGLKPIQAIQNIAVINGRPCIYGDAMIAVVQSNPICEYINEKFDNGIAYCTVKRKGEDEYTYEFGLDDAKKAQLIGKAGPWSQYPNRMCQMRARGFALRDKFSDVLKGIQVIEEVRDYQILEHTKEDKKAEASSKILNLINSKTVKVKTELDNFKELTAQANTLEDLDILADYARDIDEIYKDEARQIYKLRRAELKLSKEKIDETTGEIKQNDERLPDNSDGG